MIWLPLLLLLAQSEYRGTLAPELSVGQHVFMNGLFKLATPGERAPLGDVKGKVFAGEIQGARAFVVEQAATVLYVDTGRLTRYQLRHDDQLIADIADVEFPLPGPGYKSYPVTVYVSSGQTDPEVRMVAVSPRAFAHGTAQINGRDVPFEFEFDRAKNDAPADSGWQSVDGERTFLKDERPVYHAAGAYFSVASIDVNAREFTLTPRQANEYTRILLKAGEIFPDFAFTDFDGREHKLSDYSGKRVLLDFWATWCEPCMKALPKLRDLQAHGLQIIGMNVDEDASKARALNLPWPQATLLSIKDIVEHRARIESYPTYVLLDADRRVIAFGEYALK